MVIFLAYLWRLHIILKKMLYINIQHVFMALFEKAAIALKKNIPKVVSGAVQMCECLRHLETSAAGGLEGLWVDREAGTSSGELRLPL